MKVTIVGGGAYRVLGIMRSAMAVSNALHGGEINLYDLNVSRAEAMGHMLLKTPEQKASGCRITWGTSLEEALEGADAVGIILPAGPRKAALLSKEPCLSRGFIDSDNVSPSGALCAVRIAHVVMHVARAMEKYCPNAWLIDFVNPVAVLSGMVNNHTKVKALGVCAGFTNHLWDISRIFGKDEESTTLDVDTAGINHLSFILKGTYEGRDLFTALNEHITPNWQMTGLQPWWNEFARKNIASSVNRLVRFWRELGVLVFSTEGDGMDHLMYDEAVEGIVANYKPKSEAEIDAECAAGAAHREADDKTFQSYLDQDLDDHFWNTEWEKDLRLKRADEDIFVRIFTGLAGDREVKIATSFLNNGTIHGIKDRHVVEYSQYLFKDKLRPAGNYVIPDVTHGLIAGLAAHQTLLGDALATQDPQMLAHALLNYPIKPYTRQAREMYKELIAINSPYIPEPLRATGDYL